MTKQRLLAGILVLVSAVLFSLGLLFSLQGPAAADNSCSPWIEKDPTTFTMQIDGQNQEWEKAKFLVVSDNAYVETDGNQMRACARGEDTHLGWSVCYESRDGRCWSGTSSRSAPAPQPTRVPTPTSTAAPRPTVAPRRAPVVRQATVRRATPPPLIVVPKPTPTSRPTAIPTPKPTAIPTPTPTVRPSQRQLRP